MSWKTSLFGAVALLGALVAQFFPEVARWGNFTAALGTGLGLLFARDNDKTSEQVQAGQGNGPGLKLGLFLMLGIASLFIFTGATCKVTPQKAAFTAVNAPAVTVQQALKAWDDYVGTHTVAIADQIRVKTAYEHYQAIALLAVDAAHASANAMGGTNGFAAGLRAQLTGQNAAQALADLVNLLNNLGVKL